ncbi:MAG: hypothetical protein GZ091_17210 [Paludibacter sp.]|nr:hypothetical protein [Paludibacter sp.]
MPASTSGYVDCLDWTEMVLVPSTDLSASLEATTLKTWNRDSAKRNLSLPSMSVINNEYIIASGQWDSSDSIKSTAIYTMLEDEPIMVFDNASAKVRKRKAEIQCCIFFDDIVL